MIMLKWFLEFAPDSSLKDRLLSMSSEDFLRTLSQTHILNLPQEDMQYALIEAYEIYGLNSSILLDI